ncbi:hypothetical protein J2Z83_002949 [Virgibacillus natechei]|uniref:Uncharacterized protein n=1 Tax=Virgibacillus natechei TaxID=1216297 RepID=A0ABS4IIL6_9BACI|nr:hypothetical protein [Virgibacillus natechei]MBP1970813.1 hypothetical protein [Virgibacillus natechei]UZD12294.1 hypothetical protein OLD84_15395 [Virgibacillus natechei]
MEKNRLKAQMIETVENQIEINDPKSTNDTFNRLKKAGYAEVKAKEMIASVLFEEMAYILKNKVPFDEKRYTEKLNDLN